MTVHSSNKNMALMHDLMREGYGCAIQALRHIRDIQSLRDALHMLICPIDLWRYVEFPSVIANYGGESPVLDVGSPKLLARFLARRFDSTVIASDITPSLSRELAPYLYTRDSASVAGLRCDACQLPFCDASFPFAYAVSSLEHIGGDGDTAAIGEIARALRPHGVVVVTVPVCSSYRAIWLNRDLYGAQVKAHDGQVFFSHVYDETALYDRIIKPSGLELEAVKIWADNPPGWYENTYLPSTSGCFVRASITKLADPFLAKRHLQKCSSLPHFGRGVAVLRLRRP